MATKPKRPRDTNQLAHLIAGIATGQVKAVERSPASTKASKAGAVGGPARANALTPEQRSEIARLAAAARWKKSD